MLSADVCVCAKVWTLQWIKCGTEIKIFPSKLSIGKTACNRLIAFNLETCKQSFTVYKSNKWEAHKNVRNGTKRNRFNLFNKMSNWKQNYMVSISFVICLLLLYLTVVSSYLFFFCALYNPQVCRSVRKTVQIKKVNKTQCVCVCVFDSNERVYVRKSHLKMAMHCYQQVN